MRREFQVSSVQCSALFEAPPAEHLKLNTENSCPPFQNARYLHAPGQSFTTKSPKEAPCIKSSEPIKRSMDPSAANNSGNGLPKVASTRKPKCRLMAANGNP